MVARFLIGLALLAQHAAGEVTSLSSSNFDQHTRDNSQTLVMFYAPWCGHCKKLMPEYEKAGGTLKAKGVKLAKVDAVEEKELASRYNVKGFPTLVWFQDGKSNEYDGERTAEKIIDWVNSMTGPAVIELADRSGLPEAGDKPLMVLSADSLLPGFEAAAQSNRRKAAWYFVKAPGTKVTLTHKGEEPIELTNGAGDQEKVSAFLSDNVLPLFGRLDGDTFDKYMDTSKGLVWSLFPNKEEGFAAVEAEYRPIMVEVAKKIRGKFFVTITDTDKFKEAVENMLSITEFPAIAVQKKAGDKRKYVYTGEMSAAAISAFIADVQGGRVAPKLKSEAVPAPSEDPVRTVVGSTMESEIFLPDKDVLLEVYAPWCGHCKKLEPEYQKLAKKIKKEELTDIINIAKMDGTANDSPVDSIDWSGFPTLFFVKAGTREAIPYDGERTAKGLWKYIKKTSSKAQEIRERMERRKGGTKRAEEL